MDARLSAGERACLVAATLLYLLVVAPPVREFLERQMVTHVTVLLPALAAAGWLLALGLRNIARAASRTWNAGGILGLTTAIFAVAFWMLPRTLDESLRSSGMEIAKLTALPLLVGLPLGLSWPALGPIWRGFLKAQMISMLVALGWLYVAAPVRLCASYLQSDQQTLGQALFVIAAVLAVGWSSPCFFASHRHESETPPA